MKARATAERLGWRFLASGTAKLAAARNWLGRNGKTTTDKFLMEALLNEAGRTSARWWGRLSISVAGEARPSIRYDAGGIARSGWSRWAEGAWNAGRLELATEVSVKALECGRAAGIAFDVAVSSRTSRAIIWTHHGGRWTAHCGGSGRYLMGRFIPALCGVVINAQDERA